MGKPKVPAVPASPLTVAVQSTVQGQTVSKYPELAIGQVTEDERNFILLALNTPAMYGKDKTGKVYSGLHCQFNGVNSAFRSYFQLDSKSIRPIQVVKAMAKAGLIVSRGAYIYKAGTVIQDSTADSTLRKMGLA